MLDVRWPMSVTEFRRYIAFLLTLSQTLEIPKYHELKEFLEKN